MRSRFVLSTQQNVVQVLPTCSQECRSDPVLRTK